MLKQRFLPTKLSFFLLLEVSSWNWSKPCFLPLDCKLQERTTVHSCMFPVKSSKHLLQKELNTGVGLFLLLAYRVQKKSLFKDLSKVGGKLKRYVHRNVHAALFTIVKIWKQPERPSTDEWIKKTWYICTMEYDSYIRTNDARRSNMGGRRDCHIE